jgi:hypothetical protein
MASRYLGWIVITTGMMTLLPLMLEVGFSDVVPSFLHLTHFGR